MKAHPFDAISFVFGSLFTAIGLVFLTSAEPWDLVFDLELDWVLPALILLGGVMLLVSVVRHDDPEIEGRQGPTSDRELDSAHDELPDEPSI